MRRAVDDGAFVLRGHHGHERDFVDDLAALTSTYFAHLDMEEHGVMPALSAAMTREELMQLTETLRGSVPPAEMCRFMHSMLPAMNIAARAAMLGGMSQAPPEIWDQFHAAVVEALPAEEYRAVASRIDVD